MTISQMKFKIKDYAIRYGKNKKKKYIAEKEKVMKKIEEIKKRALRSWS